MSVFHAGYKPPDDLDQGAGAAPGACVIGMIRSFATTVIAVFAVLAGAAGSHAWAQDPHLGIV